MGPGLILTAHQPVYLPWLGLFHKVALAERFCIFDVVQYQRKDYNNRNRIKTHTGPIWLSVPVESKNHLHTKICDIKIVQDGWNKKHAKSIRFAYRNAPFFAEYIDPIEAHLLGRNYTYLTDLNTEMLKLFLNVLDIAVDLSKASDYDFHGNKSGLVLDMCLNLNAQKYIFGEQGKNYADVESFCKSGVRPYFQKYVHPAYRQINGDFVPYMSIIDLLFNVGPDSKATIMRGNAARVDDLETPDSELVSAAPQSQER
jgi:hypothetical protein